jgi:hypothetical protein
MAEELHNGKRNGYPSIEPLEISNRELIEEIGREAEERLGLDFPAFLDAYRSGTLPDTLAVNELVILLRFVELVGGIPA